MGAHAGRLGAQIVSRGKGHSAVSKAAYNARCSLDNDRLGTRDDYSRKNAECLFSGIYAPAKSPDWTRDREQLWNHVEAFEKRKDGQLARELLIDLPHELTAEQSRWFLQDFIKENFTRKGMVADLAIHAPHSHSDDRNIHAHLLIVLRKLDGTEFAKTKTRQTYAENVAELDGWKRSLEQHANKALTRHGHEARWDLRSNEAKGVDREPEIHLGKAAAALERQGIETAPGNVNREIRERNRERAAANENDHSEWVREQIAEAEASKLPELQAVQRDRDRMAELARDELEAEALPQHREAQPVFDNQEFVSALDAMRTREARERGDDSDRQARRAVNELAVTDPHGTARLFNQPPAERVKSPEELAAAANRQAAENAKTAERAELAAYAARVMEAHEQQTRLRAEAEAALARDPASPDPAPVHLDAQSRDQVDSERSRLVQFVAFGRDRLAALADRLEQAFDTVRRHHTPEPMPEASQERTEGRELVSAPVTQAEPEKPVQAPGKQRGGLFGWFTRSRTPAPEAEQAADRGADRAAGDVPHVWITPAPAQQPAYEATPQPGPAQQTVPQPAPEREQPRPAQRLVRDIADVWLAEARAELAEERDRETPEQQAEREQQDRERSRGDGSRERDRYHHSRLWELFHPFQHHHDRRNHRPP